jgi:hypothetical protein
MFVATLIRPQGAEEHAVPTRASHTLRNIFVATLLRTQDPVEYAVHSLAKPILQNQFIATNNMTAKRAGTPNSLHSYEHTAK